MQIVAVAKCLRKSILGDLGNLFFSAQGKHAASIGTIRVFCFVFYIEYPESKYIHLIKIAYLMQVIK